MEYNNLLCIDFCEVFAKIIRAMLCVIYQFDRTIIKSWYISYEILEPTKTSHAYTTSSSLRGEET